MWTRSYSKIYQNINKEDIWGLWVDIDNWPKWHDDLTYCKLYGKFEVGSYFKLKPKMSPAVKIVIIDIKPGVSYTDCTKFPGAKMLDTHSIKETPEGIQISNKIVVTGPLKWLWILLVANYVAKTIPDEIEALVSLAGVKN
jgi:hypothetical protein